MKRLLFTALFLFFIPSFLFADEVDKTLPAETSARIKDSARQVIQLGVTPDVVIKMTKSMIGDNFTEQQIVASYEVLIKAQKQRLDLAQEAIINKLHEGVTKNAGADNIIQAMEKVRGRYELANSYTQGLKVDGQESKVITRLIVECLTAKNMDQGSMVKIMGMLQDKTKNAGRDDAIKLNEKTLETTRAMARSGVDSKEIVDVMNNALKRNYNAGEMEKLGNTFTEQAKGSASATEIARTYSDAIKNGATPDNLGNLQPQMPQSIGGNPSVASQQKPMDSLNQDTGRLGQGPGGSPTQQAGPGGQPPQAAGATKMVTGAEK